MKNGIPTNPSTSSSLESQEWSEPIVVLGKGVLSWSSRYSRLIYCIAGIGEVSGWMRLYPAFQDEAVTNFDVIQVIIRDQHPDSRRPESRKIQPHSVQVIDHIREHHRQRAFLKSLAEAGNFLHGDIWRERSLGVIQPAEAHFWLTKENRVRVRYRCHASQCNTHVAEVFQVLQVDIVGRRRLLVKSAEKLLSGIQKELWFVLGTHANHPQRWMVIGIHLF